MFTKPFPRKRRSASGRDSETGCRTSGVQGRVQGGMQRWVPDAGTLYAVQGGMPGGGWVPGGMQGGMQGGMPGGGWVPGGMHRRFAHTGP